MTCPIPGMAVSCASSALRMASKSWSNAAHISRALESPTPGMPRLYIKLWQKDLPGFFDGFQQIFVRFFAEAVQGNDRSFVAGQPEIIGNSWIKPS